MAIQWSDFALQSLEEIILYYEEQGGRALADRAETEILDQVEKSNDFPEAIQESDIFPGVRRLVIRTFPYVAFIRQIG
jgi:plasmid stabilization system protein ParE